MSMTHATARSNAGRPLFLRLFALLFASLAITLGARGAEAAGTLTGNISNARTNNFLEGAVVEIPALGLTTLADNSGRFVLDGVPP